MTVPKSQVSQQTSLLRLLQADADAQARVQAAHECAQQLLAAAESEAARLLSNAQIQAQTDANAVVQPAVAGAQAAADALAGQTQQVLAEMADRAAQRTHEAVQFVVDWVAMNGR
jgi:vacuolar-type H+-ATPase subunit H